MNSRAIRNRLGDWAAREKGAAAVEFALVLPLLTLLLFAFLDVGRLLWSYHIAESSVASGARLAARLGSVCTGAGTGSLASGDAALVRNVVRFGTPDGSGPPLIAGCTGAASCPVQITVTCLNAGPTGLGGLYAGMSQIPVVQVSSTVPFSFQLAALWGSSAPFTFTVSHQEAWTE